MDIITTKWAVVDVKQGYLNSLQLSIPGPPHSSEEPEDPLPVELSNNVELSFLLYRPYHRNSSPQ